MLSLALLALTSCQSLEPLGDIGSHAMCRYLGTSQACLVERTLTSLPRLAERTGFWDISQRFPGVLDGGVGAVFEASETSGLRRVGHIASCLPHAMSGVTWQRAPERDGPFDDRVLKVSPESFAKLIGATALGPRFSEVATVLVEVESVGLESLPREQLERLVDEARASPDCQGLLVDGRYIALSALAVENVRYTLRSSTGGLPVDADSIRDFVTSDTPPHSFDAGGRIVAPGRIHVAIRGAISLREDRTAANPASLERTLAAYCHAAGC